MLIKGYEGCKETYKSILKAERPYDYSQTMTEISIDNVVLHLTQKLNNLKELEHNGSL